MNSIVYSFFFAMFLVYLAEAKQQTPLPSSITPALITADQITYDQDVSVTTARGHVEVLLYDQNKRQNLVLLADTISYHAKYDLIIATGNISLLEAGGLVIFAEYLELQRDFKSWVAQQIRVLFTNFSRISATVGIYNADSTYNLKQVAYTTCRLCDSTNLPWEINANSVSYNIKQHEVIYRDAWVKILGLPVVYVPYLSHTDQMSKYHSGFLIPHLGRTPNLGPIIRIPYFLDLSPNSNLTIEVLLSRRDMPVFSGVYHHNMQNSETKNQLSITHSKQGYIDGHVIGKTLYKINDIYKATFQVERTTSKEYIHQYSFGNHTWLTSYGSIDGFGQHSYSTARVYSFQGLRTSNDWKQDISVVMPVRYNYTGSAGWFGSYPVLNGSLLLLSNGKTINSKHLAITGSWIVPHIDSIMGERIIFKTTLRGDSHVVDNVATGSTIFLNNVLSQINYETSIEWHYPLVQLNGNNYTLIEPIATFVLTPVWKTTGIVPDINNYIFELDNTYSLGSDVSRVSLIESSKKIYYGLRIDQYYQNLGQLSVLIGQIYYRYDKPNFDSVASLDLLSDIVGQSELISESNFILLHNVRLDKATFQVLRNELTMQAGPPTMQLSVSYASIKKAMKTEQILTERTGTFSEREEITATLASSISQHWDLIFSSYYNIHLEKLLTASLTAKYEDECLAFRGTLSRDHTHDLSLRDGTAISLQIILKTLGEMQNKFYLSG